jgi:pimeloyl-ACP methyl ester carboxylesterase
MLQNIPGMKAHTYDTCHLLVEALQQLQESLQQDLKLNLSYVSCHADDTTAASSKKSSILSVIPETVREALSKVHEDDDGADADAPHICIHVCDLGPADNSIHYGPYAYLMSEMKQAAPDDKVTIRPWKASLREIPIDDIKTIPNDYPSYQAQYASVPCEVPLDVIQTIKSSGSSSFNTCLSASTTLPTAKELMGKMGVDASSSAASRNTGLYATHWGGLPYETVGCRLALDQVRSYVQDCQQDDALWFFSPKRAVAQANSNSLEHAAMQWQLQTSKSDSNQESGLHSGKPLNWLPGESIIRFLSAPMFLGTVSLRRIHSLSTSIEQPWSAIFKKETPLQSMVLAREWHVQLATQHLRQDPSAKYWRYHGFLCRYFQTDFTSNPTSSSKQSPKEAILWVHGFGASGAQWKGTVEALQKQEPQQHTAHTAFCPDLLGFGHSEKPALSYTGYLWESQMLEFVKEIMQHDTYTVGGNSIGGYTALSLAASDMACSSNPLSASGAPGTKSCTGLILLNTAGPVMTKEEITAGDKEKYSVAQQTQQQLLPPCSPPPRWVGRAFGSVLLQYLRPRIQSICVNLYPTNPSAVNSDLCENIRRDSLDPGAIYVMMAGAKLPLPRTANELLQADVGAGDTQSPEATFANRPVLIAQGVLDPLNDAKDRMERFAALRAGVTAVPIQAGHCPHDEVPEIVADEVSKWLRATQPTRAALYDASISRLLKSSL